MAYGSALVDTIQSSTTGTPPQFNDGSGAQIGTLCRAWVNFNGVTTAAIRASFNVSSVTRTGTGAYTINFTTALPSANYTFNTTTQQTSSGSALTRWVAQSTTAYSLVTTDASGVALDAPYVVMAFFN